MQYLVDTCMWIEWLCDSPLAKKVEKLFEKMDDLVVPTIVQYELYKWICREKDEETALKVIAMTKDADIIDFTTSIALTAAEYASQYKLAMADAIIYATAQDSDAIVITCDSHFKDKPGIEYHSKS